MTFGSGVPSPSQSKLPLSITTLPLSVNTLATPAPDDSYILVANQNGKLLERITSNYATNQFSFDPAATLDLASCTAPSGMPCQLADVRPDNAPIVPVITSTSRLAFVTLRGGGLLVVDPKTTPMPVRAEYDKATIQGSGLMGMQVGDDVVINSGAGFFAYRLSPRDVAATNAINQPAPTQLLADAATTRDSHGMTATPDGRFVWITDRGSVVAEGGNSAGDARQPVDRGRAGHSRRARDGPRRAGRDHRCHAGPPSGGSSPERRRAGGGPGSGRAGHQHHEHDSRASGAPASHEAAWRAGRAWPPPGVRAGRGNSGGTGRDSMGCTRAARDFVRVSLWGRNARGAPPGEPVR